MSKTYSVSIVTPSFNQGKYIKQTIDSVLSQEIPDLEYWVIDGGSTDETVDILRSYGDRLRWISEPDNGQTQAINKGWGLTRGDFISWLNADDLLAPGSIQRAVEFLQSNPVVGGVYGDCTYISDTGDPIAAYPARPYQFDTLVIETENFIPQPGTFLRRKVVELAGGLDESLHYVMDFDLWLRMGLHAPMMYLPGTVAYTRLHPQAKTLKAMDGFADDYLRTYHKLFEQPNLPERLKNQERRILSRAYTHSASFYFWGGKFAHARRTLWQAWQYQPVQRRRTFWLLFIFSILGKTGLRLAEVLHGNPYRFEKGLI